jgi:hypothetical protein
MGLLGGLLLLGGIGTVILGAIGVVAGIFMGEWHNALISAGFIAGGLVAGALAASILE